MNGEGEDMGTADMHGGEVIFKDREGNEVGFEMARLGTTKEFETVKAALATSQAAERSLDGLNADLKGKLAHREEICVAADAAYTAEKEKCADALAVSDSIRSDRDALQIETQTQRQAIAEKDAELEASNDERGRLNGLLESARAELEETQRRLDVANEEYKKLHALVAGKDAELDNLMPVKAQLDETNTALEVKGKELCEEREAAEALKADLLGLDGQLCEAAGSVLGDRNEMLGEVVTERDASRAAMAEMKQRLLTEGNRFKTILDTLAETISGE